MSTDMYGLPPQLPFTGQRLRLPLRLYLDVKEEQIGFDLA
jgi:hypothetical protein